MDKYQEALSLFDQNKYVQALNLFRLVVQSSQQHTQDQIEDAYEKMILIAEVENDRSVFVETCMDAANYYLGLNSLKQSLAMFKMAMENAPAGSRKSCLLAMIKINGLLGYLEERDKLARKYLDYCLSRKFISEGLRFIEESVEGENKSYDLAFAEIKLLIICGDVEKLRPALLAFMQKYMKNMGRKTMIANRNIIDSLVELMGDNGLDERAPYLYNILLVRKHLESLVVDRQMNGIHRSVDNKFNKLLLKMFIELVVLDCTSEVLSLMKLYCEVAGNRELFDFTNAFVEKNGYELLEYRCEELISTSIKKDHRMTLKKYSVSVGMVDEKIRKKVKDLERQIILHSRMKKWKRVGELCKTLENIEPQNKLVQRMKMRHICRRQLEEVAGYSNSELYDNLQKDLQRFVVRDSVNIAAMENEQYKYHLWEAEFLKRFETENLNEKNYRDYFVLFYTFGFHKVSLLIIERMKQVIAFDDMEMWAEVLYLEAVVYEYMGAYEEALEIIHHVKNNLEINLEEALCFTYMEGEILLRQERMKEAKEMFRVIFAIDPKYRFVKDRLVLIESLSK